MTTALAAVTAVALAASERQAAPAAQKVNDLFVSPAGDDSASCTERAPCLSLQRAFDVAKPGAHVVLAEGTYAGQALSGTKGGGRPVVFAGAAGSRVVFSGRLTLHDLAHVVIAGITFQTADPYFDLMLDACNEDVTLKGLSGRRFIVLEGNQSIRFRGGSWGGYSTPGEEDSVVGTSGSGGPTRTCGGTLAPPVRDLVFDGVTWHDVFYNVPASSLGGSHPDCFEINGFVDGVVIRNSTFTRCGNTFLMIDTDQGAVRNILIEANRFVDVSNDTYYGVQIVSTGSGTCDGLVFRRNSYFPNTPSGLAPQAPIRTECTAPAGGTPALITHNLFQRAPLPFDCGRYLRPPASVRWQDNMFGEGACGAEASGVPFGYQLASPGLTLARSQAASIRRVFAEAASGAPAARIARSLRQRRFTPPPGGWRAPAVRRILSTQAYVGGLYGATGAHPAIVTRKAWTAAQRALH